MKEYPKLTVIIPCKNAGKTIQKTFDSLRNQKYKNFECIVMDANSTDNTMDIVEKNRDIIHTAISEDDKGGPDAANKAIKFCSGDAIGFLYADDYLVENALEDIANAMVDFPKNDVYSYGLSIEDLNTQKKILESYSKKDISLCLNNVLFKHVLNHFYRKHVFDKVGPFKVSNFKGTIFFSNDREFLLRLCLNDMKNYVIEKVLYKMTTHKESFTGSRKNIVIIREEHIDFGNYFLKNYNLSVYKKNKLLLFVAHNLALLFVWYLITLKLKDAINIFIEGYSLRGFYWIIDIIVRPLSEIRYRMSVKYWF